MTARICFIIAASWIWLGGEIASAASFSLVNSGLPGIYGGFVQWGDFDQDGHLDLLISGNLNVSGFGAQVWRNNNGSFTNSGQIFPVGYYHNATWADLDNDGDLDILFTYNNPTSNAGVTQLYRNDSGVFNDSHMSLPGAFGGPFALGDIDKDGDLDFIVVGGFYNSGGFNLLRNDHGSFFPLNSGLPSALNGPVILADFDGDGDADVILGNAGSIQYWRNNNGVFTNINVGLPVASLVAIAVGDYDNDGDLDLAIASQTANGFFIQIFRNSNGMFTDIGAGLPSLMNVGLAWGDFDNDGDLDLALCGQNASGFVTQIWRNNNGVFTDIGAGLTGVAGFAGFAPAALAWGDYDNDGALDLLIAGNSSSGAINQIWHNNTAVHNSPPTAPTGLAASITASRVTLSWNPATDAQTLAAGLSYNIRVGSAPGGVDVVSPQANLNSGFRLLAQRGNVPTGTSAVLDLAAGTYYWSVQAIDTAFAGGPFATEGSFTVASATPIADTLAADGFLSTSANLHGLVNPRGMSTAVWFEWGTSTAYGQTTAVQNISGIIPLTTSQTISTLTIETTYHCRVVATNAAGATFGADQVFTTPRFVLLASGGPTFPGGYAAWCDFDNDGDLDMAISGFDPITFARHTKIWRNDNGVFTDINAGLPDTWDNLAWGDFDNDGYLDIVVMGYGYTNQIWRNNHGIFSAINAGLPGVGNGSVNWGDYDNNGFLDLLISGNGFGIGGVIQVWNNTSGVFQNANANLPVQGNPMGAWGDFNNDGKLDVLDYGGVGSIDNPGATLFRNDTTLFTDVGVTLPPIALGVAVWGDYDNDGDLDLAIISHTGSKILRNDGGGIFTDIGANLPNLQNGSAAWGDIDNDGDLDLVISGIAGGGIGVTKVLRNDAGTFVDTLAVIPGNNSVAWGDYDNDGDLDLLFGNQIWKNLTTALNGNTIPANNSPTAPTGLATTVTGSAVNLSWLAATDVETPAISLSYNLRVGTSTGAGDVVSPQAAANGFRRLPALGNAQLSTSAKLDLPVGTYYWSVQAIDGAFAGGPFSSESTFSVASAVPIATTIAADNVQSTAGVLHGVVNPRGMPTTCWFEWGATTAYGHTTAVQNLSGSLAVSVSSSLTGLGIGSVYHFRVVANNAAGTVHGSDRTMVTVQFASSGISLTGVSSGAAALGDYDDDGYLDLLVMGGSNIGAITELYRNSGTGTFSNVGAGLPGFYSGMAAWVDFDNSGTLDIVLTGTDTNNHFLTRTIQNNSLSFASVGSNLPADPFLSYFSAGDFNNDGMPDLYVNGGSPLWRNVKGCFSDQSSSLPLVYSGETDWGDFDNDGFLDVALAGAAVDPSMIARNNGDGTFSTVALPLTAFFHARIAWADYNNDGFEDLFISGFDSSGLVVQLYRNNGNGTFAAIDLPIVTQVDNVAWGDFNNDGYLDLAVAGNGSAQVLRNNGDDTFTDMVVGLPAINSGSVAWGDYDNDGDLDLVITGQVGNNAITEIWRNDGTVSNTPPTTPSNPTSIVSSNRISFSWNAASDAQTPTLGLTYNIRIGSSPGAVDVVSPESNAQTGFRRVPRFGNCHHRTNYILFGSFLPAGTYYWSVQAVDTAFAGGPWAAEQSFVIADTDGDGLPDWWELAHGLNPNSAADAALDSDGDGFTNAQEFAADTNPQDATDSLRITSTQPNGADVIVSFTTALHKLYRLEHSIVSPAGPWTIVQDNVAGTGGIVSATDVGGAAAGFSFYHVIVLP
ncbi:MAG: VCBS repeat-containing protein [Verrucomicrobia bacterium]|nr:VCBS repeat-containing protein [Verrucomicrobiota bacterium]